MKSYLKMLAAAGLCRRSAAGRVAMLYTHRPDFMLQLQGLLDRLPWRKKVLIFDDGMRPLEDFIVRLGESISV